MLNKRVTPLPGLDNDKLLTNAQHLESALDEWHESGLDTSSDVLALQAFANRWRRNAMLIALRALRRVEDLRLAETHDPTDAGSTAGVDRDDAAGDTPRDMRRDVKKRLSTPEYYEQAIADWAASGLDTSTNPDEFSAFGAKWRATATLIALRADRRVDQLRTLEAHGRELQARQLLEAEAQRQREIARVADAERAFKAAQIVASGTGDNNAANALGRYERELGDWGARGLDKTQKADDLVGFATKWRQDPTLVALGAERRVDHLRALEFDARGGRVRSGTAADRRPVVVADDASHQEGMAAASAQAAAASFAYGALDLYEPAPAARPLMERTYSVTENFNFALDDWQDSGLDESSDIAAFQAFVARWKSDATLIALRAERRIETLREQQVSRVAARIQAAERAAAGGSHLDYIARHPIDLAAIDLAAVEQASPVAAPPQLTSAEHIAIAVREWDAAGLEFSGDRSALTAFSDRWRRDAEIISLRADRRLEELRAEKLRLDPDWQETLRANTVLAYEAFQAKHPHSQYQKELAKRMLLIDDERAWRKTGALGTTDAYRAYLQAWPSGSYNREARVGMMGGTAVAVAAGAPSETAVEAGLTETGLAETGSTETVSRAVPRVPTPPLVAVSPVVEAAVQSPSIAVASASGADVRRAEKAPRLMLLTWLAVLALAAAGALLTYFVLPQRLNVASAPQPQQTASAASLAGPEVAAPAVTATVTVPEGNRTGAPFAAASAVSAAPQRATAQFNPPVEEPVPNTLATIAAGHAVTPARQVSDTAPSSDAAAPVATLSPLNDWNVATAAHAGWSVRLAPLNDWNVATAAHAGWSVRLAPLNDWNVATAAHAGWSVRLAPLNDWNVATAAHADWRVRLAASDDANGPTLPHAHWAERLAASNAWNGGTLPHANWRVYLAKANDWNTATLPHQNWTERLAGRNSWNALVTGPHLGWRPLLAPANDWNVATAPHAGWPLRLRPANVWSGPVRPHRIWPELSFIDDIVVRLIEPQLEGGATSLVQAADTGLISTASIPVAALPRTVSAAENLPKVNSLKRRDPLVEAASTAPVRAPVALKPQRKRPPLVEEAVELAPTPVAKRVARPVVEPEPEPEVKPEVKRPPPPVAPKVEAPRRDSPKQAATKEDIKPSVAKEAANPVSAKLPVAANAAPPANAWLRDVFSSRN
jgi:hypothetical protein